MYLEIAHSMAPTYLSWSFYSNSPVEFLFLSLLEFSLVHGPHCPFPSLDTHKALMQAQVVTDRILQEPHAAVRSCKWYENYKNNYNAETKKSFSVFLWQRDRIPKKECGTKVLIHMNFICDSWVSVTYLVTVWYGIPSRLNCCVWSRGTFA